MAEPKELHNYQKPIRQSRRPPPSQSVPSANDKLFNMTQALSPNKLNKLNLNRSPLYPTLQQFGSSEVAPFEIPNKTIVLSQ